MAESSTTEFTYSLVQRLIQEAHYNQAIALLSKRIDSQPQDRMARLLLLLANISQFGSSTFHRHIDELRQLADLSSNERHIVRQIFLVCFGHAERDGQTIQKIAYQRLIRRLMLNQPLDLSIADASALEQDEAMASPDVQSAPSSWPSVHSAPADRDLPAAPNRRWNRWDEYVLIGAGAMIVAVLLVFSQLKGRQPQFAQIPIKLIAFDSDDLGESEHAVDHRDSAVTLLSKAMAEPIRRQVVSQLAALNKAYSRWIEGDPTTHGTVTLKLRVEPSGKVSKVEEVVSRLSEHRFLEVIIAEAKLWQLPHGGSSASEIVVPLVFNPRAMTPALQVAGLSKADAASTDVEIATAHTEFPLEVAEAAAPVAPMVAHNQAVLEPHTRGLLEPVIAEKQVAAEFRRNDAAKEQVAKRHETVEALALAESEIARAAALKHEPRFAADAIEKVSRGTRVTVLQKERDWFKVKVRSSGSIGYLRKEYLSPFHALR